MGKVSVNVMVYLCLYIYNKSNMEEYANWYNGMLNSKGVAMEQYINDMLTWDVYNFANIKQKPGDEVVWDVDMQKEEIFWTPSVEYLLKSELLTRLRMCSEGNIVFHIPAMLLGPVWFIYRKMHMCALISEGILMVMIYMIFMTDNMKYEKLILLGCYLFFVSIIGFVALPLYYRHIHNRLKKRRILQRLHVQIEELDISLRKEGKPSKLAAVIGVILNIMLYCILGDLAFTMDMLPWYVW